MPASKETKKVLAIARNQTHSRREVFLAEVRDSLPRSSFDDESLGEAGRRSIQRSIDADRFLRDCGFDRGGRPLNAGRSAAA